MAKSVGHDRSAGVAGVGVGLAFALLAVAAMTGLYAIVLLPSPELVSVQQQITQKLQGLNLSSPVAYVAVALFYSLVHSALEEYYWRWFVYRQLRVTQSPMRAAVISSLAFMAHHVILLATYFGWSSPWTYLTSAGVACGGLAWASIYERSGNLLATWISHLVVDATIFAIGYHMASQLFVSR